jgi:hypothetical protein
MALYRIYNGVMPTAASQVAVTTGTAIKTLLQVKAGATKPLKITAWGISFDGSAAATPGIVELCETDVAATVTTLATADIHKIDGEALAGGDPTTNLILVGTTSTGFTASGEGTITAIRQFDVLQLPPTGPYIYQMPLGNEPIIQVSKFGRIRVKFAAAINAICWMEIEV